LKKREGTGRKRERGENRESRARIESI